MASIIDNLQAVRMRIERAARDAGRRADTVRLLAVSKGQSVAKIGAAVDAGQRSFGENYVQEALDKMSALPKLEWHLIGALQSNKTRLVAERFDWVQTVASEKIARRLSEQRPANLPPLNVLIQVNVSGEATKSGMAPSEVQSLASRIATLKNVSLRGLMAIPEPGAPRERFREVLSLYEALRDQHGLDTLSMGMSDDLENAIAEGATLVRIGTAIFGARAAVKSAA